MKFDLIKKSVSIIGSLNHACEFSLDEKQVLKLFELKSKTAPESPENWDLIAHCTDRNYLEMVANALQDIRNGRDYQINLLRFFNFKAKKQDYLNPQSYKLQLPLLYLDAI